MTYDASEIGLTSGEPLELFRFAQGSEVLRYTSSDTDVTFNDPAPEIFVRENIERSSPTQSADGKPSSLVLTVHRNMEVAQRFRVFVPAATMSITIFRTHRSAVADSIVYWKGLVRSVSWSGQFAKITCESIDSILKVEGLRFSYQAPCNHFLFAPGCNLSNAAFQRSGTITLIDGNEITSTMFGLEAPGWFAGGTAEVGGAEGLIVGTTGDVAVLLRPFENIQIGDTVNGLPGCARNVPTCQNKFANLANYGGFPQIPTNNPFDVGIEGQQSFGGYVIP